MGIVAASASISTSGFARLGQQIRLCNIGWSMNVFDLIVVLRAVFQDIEVMALAARELPSQ